MSWADSILASSMSASLSAVDSRRFEFPVTRIVVPIGDDRSGAGDITRAVGQQPARIHIVRYPATRVGWYSQLVDAHDRVIHADTLIYWSRKIRQADERTVEDLRAATPDETGAFVRATFSAYPNHYSANPAFAPDRVAAGYQEWSRRAAEEGRALGLFDHDQLVGLATVSTHADVLEVELAGIAPDRQKQGRYQHLLAGVNAHAMGRSMAAVVISTQSSQTHVQRSWARAGFEPVAALETVHVMGCRGAP